MNTKEIKWVERETYSAHTVCQRILNFQILMIKTISKLFSRNKREFLWTD